RAVTFLIGVTAVFLRIDAEARHANLGSRPDWVDPHYTPFDTFLLGFPPSPFLITGGALLLVALVWAVFRKFSNLGTPKFKNGHQAPRATIAGTSASGRQERKVSICAGFPVSRPSTVHT